MIKILILTSNISEWVAKVCKNLSDYSARKLNNGKVVLISSDMFRFEIREAFQESVKGSCHSCAILDTYISDEIERYVVRPCVKSSIIHTNNYIKERMSSYD